MESKNIDFEAWARTLIVRKVPEDFVGLVNFEVVRCGAEILKRGHGFEVHLEPERSNNPHSPRLSTLRCRILVTPFPSRAARF